MLKAQNKENEQQQQQQQITKKMNASEVKEYKEDEDEERSNNPSCENRELSGWFFKKGELLNRWNERYVSVDEKIRTLSFYSSSSSLSSSKPTSIVSFDALEKFSSRKGGEKGEEDAIIIRVQLQNGKDLFLKRNNNPQQQQKKKKKSYLFKERGEEEWCAKMNALLNLLPTPECRQKRGGGIRNTTLSALKNSSSGRRRRQKYSHEYQSRYKDATFCDASSH